MAPLNRFPRMVQENYVDHLRRIERAGDVRKAAIQTREQVEAYLRETRTRVAACFGPLPERTPLEARTTGELERDTYRVEKILFQSRPEFYVTANLYLPKGRPTPLPAVVGSCGHSSEGKAAGAYQSFAQGLARMGYVVLLFDPIGQGERLQYVNAEGGSSVGVGVREHLYCGNPQFLAGEFFGTWRAWDGIRALDYLLERPEVDPRHVGITGNSGGGTMTTWLLSMEPRWTMGAPGCFVTTFRRNLENELPADTEQCPPRALGLGLDMDDFLAAGAPRPLILLTKERDYFDQRGAQEAFARLKRLYTALGRPDDVAIFTGPTGHGYSQENREAMYRFFNRVTGISDAQSEPPLQLEREEDLRVTRSGQVAELPSRPVYAFTRAMSREQAARRGEPRGADLRARITSLLKLPERAGAPEYRILRPLPRREGYPRPHAAVYAVESEPGIQVLVSMLSADPWVSRPPRPTAGAEALVYVPHLSSDADLTAEPLVRELCDGLAEGSRLFACDLRGMGESQPDTCGVNTVRTPYGCDFFYAIHAIMLDQPYLGRRVHDLLAVCDWLEAHGYPSIHLAARGQGAVPAALAALLDDRITRVTLKNALTSFAEIAEEERYSWPLSSFLPNVLKVCDLPDVYAELSARKGLALPEPWRAADFRFE
jgi:dienelactone hydrolase/pimeloyl-ACP methyl ester carboxylesterase